MKASQWHRLFEYDGLNLVRKVKAGRFLAGTIAGTQRISREDAVVHLVVGINYRRHYVHRIIWEMHHGPIPEGMQIDHIDGDGLNNRLGNLRLVDHQGNKKNQRKSRACKTGLMGVGWHKASGKWRATIQHDGKQIHLGLHDSYLDAACARKAAEVRYGFHANHGR